MVKCKKSKKSTKFVCQLVLLYSVYFWTQKLRQRDNVTARRKRSGGIDTKYSIIEFLIMLFFFLLLPFCPSEVPAMSNQVEVVSVDSRDSSTQGSSVIIIDSQGSDNGNYESSMKLYGWRYTQTILYP